jgi:4-hydroxyphenylpyruvate dioxygenase
MSMTEHRTMDAVVPRPLELRGYDHLELWVGNAKQAAHYYRTALGFDLVAYAGPETGMAGRASYVMQQGRVRFVLTAGLTADHPVVRHQARHGDGVQAVAFEVDDVDETFATVVRRGARIVDDPQDHEDGDGVVRTAAVAAYGDTVHRFVDRSHYRGPFLPGYESRVRLAPNPAGLRAIDHVVANVRDRDMDRWSSYYADVFGFRELVHFDDAQISTEFTALRSRVMWDGAGAVKLPINEPAKGRRRSQIEEYLDFYGGEGVQHIALATDDIVATVDAMQAAGVEFLDTPATYYDRQRQRLDVGALRVPLDVLAERKILVDEDAGGYLLQIFTKPIEDRPTVFFELIERHGCEGFGVGNFQALFESIEREQARRGTL